MAFNGITSIQPLHENQSVSSKNKMVTHTDLINLLVFLKLKSPLRSSPCSFSLYHWLSLPRLRLPALACDLQVTDTLLAESWSWPRLSTYSSTWEQQQWYAGWQQSGILNKGNIQPKAHNFTYFLFILIWTSVINLDNIL